MRDTRMMMSDDMMISCNIQIRKIWRLFARLDYFYRWKLARRITLGEMLSENISEWGMTGLKPFLNFARTIIIPHPSRVLLMQCKDWLIIPLTIHTELKRDTHNIIPSRDRSKGNENESKVNAVNASLIVYLSTKQFPATKQFLVLYTELLSAKELGRASCVNKDVWQPNAER